MTDRAHPALLETLLAERAWVRALARSLVASEADAADVEQETWLAALRRPPGDDSRPRAWLATVVRNHVRLLWRRTGRRTRIERVAAQPEAVVDPSDSVAHADALRSLVAALVALREPYRGTLLLRYFEGLSPDEIARREGSPVGTVKTRLRRGLELLREALDGELGGERRRAMLLLVAGHASRRMVGPAGSSIAGGVIVATKTKALAVAAAALLLLAGLLWWSTRYDQSVADPSTAVAQEVVSNHLAVGRERRRPQRVSEATAPAPTTADTAAAVAAVPDPPERIRGRVTDDANGPLPGARVSCPLGDTVSKDDGTFEFDAKASDGTMVPVSLKLRAAKPGFEGTDVTATLPLVAPISIRLVRQTTIHGHVFDLEGHPLPRAHVVVDGIAHGVDEDGAFSLALGDPPLTEFVVIAPAKRTRPVRVTSLGRDNDVYLFPGHPCRIRVVDEFGSPVAGASVFIPATGFWGMGVNSALRVVTDGDGRTPDFGIGYKGSPENGVAGNMMVDVTCPGYAPVHLSLGGGKKPYDLEITLRHAVKVLVHLATASRDPAAGWTVGLFPRPRAATDLGDVRTAPVESRVDAQGFARLTGAEAGRDYIVVARQGDAPAEEARLRWTVLAESFVVPEGGGDWRGTLPPLVRVGLEFLDEKGGAVGGCVAHIAAAREVARGHQDDQEPPPQRMLALLTRGPVARVTADGRGMGEVFVEPGEYEVSATSSVAQTAAVRTPFTVAVDGARVVVPMRLGATLTGDVVTNAGWPVAGAEVSVGAMAYEARPMVKTRTDGRGAFAVTGLMAGRYHVTVAGPAGDAGALTVSDVEVPREPLHIVMAIRVVRGRIVGGRRIGYLVYCTRSKPVMTTWSDLDGNFVFDGVSDGPLSIQVMSGDQGGVWGGNVDRDMDVVIPIKK